MHSSTERRRRKAEPVFSRSYSYYVDIFKGTIIPVGRGPELQLITPGSISLGLLSASVVSRVPPIVTPIPTDTNGTPLSTSIDHDAPSASTSQTT
ncbi:hypothetical protein Tco_0494704 [Tanacetum coccineum]